MPTIFRNPDDQLYTVLSVNDKLHAKQLGHEVEQLYIFSLEYFTTSINNKFMESVIPTDVTYFIILIWQNTVIQVCNMQMYSLKGFSSAVSFPVFCRKFPHETLTQNPSWLLYPTRVFFFFFFPPSEKLKILKKVWVVGGCKHKLSHTGSFFI